MEHRRQIIFKSKEADIRIKLFITGQYSIQANINIIPLTLNKIKIIHTRCNKLNSCVEKDHLRQIIPVRKITTQNQNLGYYCYLQQNSSTRFG